MELSNINKLSMSIALAIMSDRYTLTKYNIRQARNKSMYEIKDESGDKSYIIGFDEEKDYHEMFADIMQNVLLERFPKKRVPTADELNEGRFSSKKFVDIVNSYSLDAPDHNSQEYAGQLDVFSRIVGNMMTMCDLSEEANQLNLETKTISSAVFMLDRTLMHRYYSTLLCCA